MKSPAAEVDIDERLVRALLKAQHPDLADLALTQLGFGWDNTLWRLGEDLMVRLPRRALAAPLIENEQRWLPELAPHLPLPVPVPVRTGQPSADYPWTWSLVPWIDGQPGDRATITEPFDAAQRLGRFLRALHQPAPGDAPHNPGRSVSLVSRTEVLEQRLDHLVGELDPVEVRRLWTWALAADPWPGPPTWLHGDLHPANLLIDHGTLAGVIDFGDLCAGDPATDLAGAWMLLPTAALASFRNAYGGVDPQLERRSVGWAVHFALILLGIGLDDKPSYAEIARTTLTRLLTVG